MRTWFITGASRGFGARITEEALANGDAVVATARDPENISARFGEHERLLPCRLDVTREEEARAAVDLGLERFGRIDVLLNNAGYGLLSAVEEASGAEVERIFATNVFGLLAVTRSVLPSMRERRSGHIINISSIGGYAAAPGWGIYCATKFAVEAITEALTTELAPLGIHATVVEPGYFRTDFLDGQSLSKTAKQISDYADTVGATRTHAASANHAQLGDPKKLAKAMMVLVNAPKPPTRLPLGTDTIKTIEQKNESVAAELADWRNVSVSTDWGDTQPATQH